ncbi:MAG: benzoate/H(+) symporter BenE family transporter, partial [Pseudomonadota bacterium]
AIRPLSRLVGRLPKAIAAGMLAGILFRFCLSIVGAAEAAPVFVLALVAIFFLTQVWRASLAVPLVLAVGVVIPFADGSISLDCCRFAVTEVIFFSPSWDWPVILGLGLPLYLVTMASQNLTGLAVLKADGFAPPVGGSVGPTGLVSICTALFGGHSVCLAAITAAICTGPSCHPDPAQRWKAGPVIAVSYLIFAAFTVSFVDLMLALPPALITTFAGLALFAPFKGSLVAALSGEERDKEAAAVTFVVAASGLSLLSMGAAFWALVAGLLIYGLRGLRKS